MLESKAKQTGNISRNDGECQNHVLLSLRFLILSFLSVVTVSFITGRHCQLLILSALERSPVDSIDYDTSSLEYARLTVNCTDKPTDTSDLDEVPNDHESTESEVNDDIIPGRQLLVDIENVDGLFLDSNHLLRRAIINYLEERKINDVVFQPQCSSTSNGLFCYVMLRDGGRITLGTWPLRGTISITIMINDSKETLLSDLEMIEQIFGIPRKRSRFGPQVQEPYLRWATKTRGFFEKLQNVEEVDIKSYITSPLDRPWKKRVASIETKYQSIEIYDMLHPRLGSMETYTNMKNSLDSYEAKNRHLFRPDRLVYLDGVLQSRFFGEAAYHESLVHPAVLAHPNPRRVAIIGGGEGATMREVLKHKTIENVTMIDIDEEMVRFSRQYLPEWSDCSFLEGDDGSCYDDPRSEFFGLDAVAWFMDRYGGEKEVRDYEGKQYDVIIMDAL
jgi:spermidine synthase